MLHRPKCHVWFGFLLPAKLPAGKQPVAANLDYSEVDFGVYGVEESTVLRAKFDPHLCRGRIRDPKLYFVKLNLGT